MFSDSHLCSYNRVLDNRYSDKARSLSSPPPNQSSPRFGNFPAGYMDVSQSGGEAPWEMQIQIQLFLSTNMSRFKIKISVHNKPPTTKV